MKRKWAIRLTLWLLLISGGAIVNIAVAWGVAYTLDQTQMPNRFDSEFFSAESQNLSWFALIRRGPGWSFDITYVERTDDEISYAWLKALRDSYWGDGIPNQRRISGLPDWSPGPESLKNPSTHRVRCAVASGWPLLSMSMDHEASLPIRASKIQLSHAIMLPSTNLSQSFWENPMALPTHLIWPGFAINTIFYAAILWAIFFIPGKVRRAIRLRRGLCPACAYPVGTSPVCTECGEPVRQRPAISDQQSALDNQS